MGTLTKKLHILKTGGTEETCDIYTTTQEVGGSPYLALEVDGTKGYVKLGSTTDANATHLRVEKNGTTYAAWKKATVAIPTGSLRVTSDITFTVPAGITVIAINEGSSTNYIRVSPNSTHRLKWNRFDLGGEIVMWFMRCDTHPDSDFWTAVAHDSQDVTLYWSPEINKHSTNMNCP